MARPKNADSHEGRLRQEAKYQRILDAALQVFAGQGYHDSKISDIARVAGVADGTIYLYFKNKDDIVATVFDAHLNAINRGMRKTLSAASSCEERMSLAVNYHLNLALENPSLARFLTIEIKGSSKFMFTHGKEQFRRYIANFAGIISDAKARGLVPAHVNAKMSAYMIFGALDHACVAWLNNPKREDQELLSFGPFLCATLWNGVIQKS